MSYYQPLTLEEALDLRAGGDFAILAGGTDFFPSRVAQPLRDSVLDISALTDLRGISRIEAGGVAAGDASWRIGALTTWSDLLREAKAQAPVLAALVSAAREVGGIQVQNQATVGGNLCNASPAADGVPALAALDARVELRSARGIRSLALVEFVQGNRRTQLASDEILTAITLPVFSSNARSQFRKIGHRKYLVISIAMVAVCVDFDQQGTLSRCGIAVGSCAPSVRRLGAMEAGLVGLPRAQVLGQVQAELDRADSLQVLTPIDDIRGSAGYRLAAVRQLLYRLFAELLE